METVDTTTLLSILNSDDPTDIEGVQLRCTGCLAVIDDQMDGVEALYDNAWQITDLLCPDCYAQFKALREILDRH